MACTSARIRGHHLAARQEADAHAIVVADQPERARYRHHALGREQVLPGRKVHVPDEAGGHLRRRRQLRNLLPQTPGELRETVVGRLRQPRQFQQEAPEIREGSWRRDAVLPGVEEMEAGGHATSGARKARPVNPPEVAYQIGMHPPLHCI